MRINRYIAVSTGLSRRASDQLIVEGRVTVNNQPVQAGQQVQDGDIVTLDGKVVKVKARTTIMLHKPVGVVVSRNGQGSQTIYDLLPAELHTLKPVGRLDKDSSGLLLLTNDGQLANELTHPSYMKQKQYEVGLDKPLTDTDKHQIEHGVDLEDGPSRLQLEGNSTKWLVTMGEGRNRQIRRTFAALGYEVKQLHRIQFGDYKLGKLSAGDYQQLKT